MQVKRCEELGRPAALEPEEDDSNENAGRDADELAAGASEGAEEYSQGVAAYIAELEADFIQDDTENIAQPAAMGVAAGRHGLSEPAQQLPGAGIVLGSRSDLVQVRSHIVACLDCTHASAYALCSENSSCCLILRIGPAHCIVAIKQHATYRSRKVGFRSVQLFFVIKLRRLCAG